MLVSKPARALWRRTRKVFEQKSIKVLHEALAALPDDTSISLLDIGAAGDIEPRWKKVSSLLDYTGFEPDRRSNAELIEKGSICKSYRIIPKAVWDEEGIININLCKKPMVSSHFMPNREFLDRFKDSERFNIESNVSVETTRLDDLGIKNSDFIKIDIQGGELHALKGATKLLKDTIGLELEVEFLPLYQKQPLFGELVEFLGEFNFEFIDFVALCRWERAAHNGFGQCVFGDALFLKSPEHLISSEGANRPTIYKYLTICLIYNRFDLIDKTLAMIDSLQLAKLAAFIEKLEPLRRKQKRAQKISKIASNLLNVSGHEYRSHLMY